MVHVKPIRTEADHEAALKRIEELMDAPEGSPEDDELGVLADLVFCYEDRHYPMGWPSLAESIRFGLDQHGLCERDLVPWLGDESTVAAVLAGERALTLPMMRALHERLGIPADVLLREPA